MPGPYFKIYGAQICPIFMKQVALVRDITRTEYHSIKSGILYSFDLSQRAKEGIMSSDIEVDWENMSGI